MKPNDGIFQDGLDCAFIGNGSPIDNDYGTITTAPHLHFQRWSWLLGYAEGLKMKMEQADSTKEPHEQGLRNLFATINPPVHQAIRHVDECRMALRKAAEATDRAKREKMSLR